MKPKRGGQVRRKAEGRFGLVFPPSAERLLQWVQKENPNSEFFSFAVPGLPPSLNRIYRPGFRPGDRILSDEALIFRKEVKAALFGRRWKLKGLLFVMVFYESPHWISLRNEVRANDIDNRQKALFDAFKIASGVDDARIWEYHAYKIASDKVQTSFFCLDLGDIVGVYRS